jgi:hypothetical protein
MAKAMNPAAPSLLLAVVFLASTWTAFGRESDRTLSRAVLLDKIRGGWAGQMIGVAYGAPTEFKSNGKIGEWDLRWTPEMLDNTIEQDDLYVEMTFAKVMDDVGLGATSGLRRRLSRIEIPPLARQRRRPPNSRTKASTPRGPGIRNTTSTPTTSTSRSRPTSSASCAPASRANRIATATASAGS